MTPSDQTPKLPTWIFIVTDLALIGTAVLIALNSPRPFSEMTTFWIVICLIFGAIFGLIPIIARYERVKNETLDDRQSALEALSRTVSSSAEQISIAANGLNGIAELSLKNLRHAEHLPQKLQEKIAEFQAVLATANDTEKDELEKELVALRTTESERLESISEKISKSAADWAKLESATQKNLAGSQALIERAATESLTQLTTSTTTAVAQAATAAAAAIAQASASANESLATASAAAINQAAAAAREHLSSTATAAEQSLAQAHARLTAELEEKLASVARTASTATTLAETLTTLEAKITASTERLERALEAAAKAPPPAPVVISAPPATIVTDPDPVAAFEPTLAPVAESTSVAPPSTEATAHPPKRPRKPRREHSAAEDAPATPAVETAATPEPAPPLPSPSSPDEPAPIPATAIAEIAPVTPATVDPFEPPALPPQPEPVVEAPAPAPAEPAPDPIIELPSPEPALAAAEVTLPPATPEPSPEPAPAPAEPIVETPAPATEAEPAAPAEEAPAPEPVAPEDEEPKPIRKRAAKKPEPDEDAEPGLGLEIDDTPAPQSAELAERVLTSDGATRLIATAYIGIGNRLFIRGEGPGLSWEKGVPLQFVSIGKWRWETSDANSPVSFKLYKNDTVECTALGVQNLDPGHQQELTASF